jgi:hypothetical protein
MSGKGTTSVVPLSLQKLAALQRLRFAFGAKDFLRSLVTPRESDFEGGAASQAAEKSFAENIPGKGTTSVVPLSLF